MISKVKREKIVEKLFSKKAIQSAIGIVILTLISIILPAVFHTIGGANSGAMLLPLHIPVLIAGLLLGPVSGVTVACFSLLLNSALTGMPSVQRMPFIFIELATYGIVCGILQKKNYNSYLTLIMALVAGRLVNALALFVSFDLLKIDIPTVVSTYQAFIIGIPGVIIQLILVPVVILVAKRSRKKWKLN